MMSRKLSSSIFLPISYQRLLIRNMPMSTATLVRLYRNNSEIDATWAAMFCIWGSELEMNTKKMMREMMMITRIRIPQNIPVFAWLQSTL